MGSDLGGAVKGFKDGMREASDAPNDKPGNVTQQVGGQTIEGEIKEKTHS
jgi:sec-independent protein translocase protein TatA